MPVKQRPSIIRKRFILSEAEGFMRKRAEVEQDIRGTDARCAIEVLLDLRDLLVKLRCAVSKQGREKKKQNKKRKDVA